MDALRDVEAAVAAVAATIRCTFGPLGRTVLVQQPQPAPCVATRDGAQLLRRLSLQHPAAQLLVQLSVGQEAAIGDGTTGVVLLAAAVLSRAAVYVERGVPPRQLTRQLQRGVELVQRHALPELTVNAAGVGEAATSAVSREATSGNGGDVATASAVSPRAEGSTAPATDSLPPPSCANGSAAAGGDRASVLATALASCPLASLVQQLLLQVPAVALETLACSAVPGGIPSDSFAFNGVLVPLAVRYAGHDQLPRCRDAPRILLLSCALELQHAPGTSSRVSVSQPQHVSEFVAAEWAVLMTALDAIIDAGVTLVLSSASVGDVATQVFLRRGVFCAGRIPSASMHRLAHAFALPILSSVSLLSPTTHTTLAARYDLLGGTGSPLLLRLAGGTAWHVCLRGAAEDTLQEMLRSLDDGRAVLRHWYRQPAVVPGAGCVDVCLADALRRSADDAGTAVLAAALLDIPRILASNAGLPAAQLVAEMRQRVAADPSARPYLNIANACVSTDVSHLRVWDLAAGKAHAVSAAVHAASALLCVGRVVMLPLALTEEQRGDAAARAIEQQRRVQRRVARRMSQQQVQRQREIGAAVSGQRL